MPTLPSIADVKKAIYASIVLKPTGDGDWTRAVKSIVGGLGISHGWDVCTASLGYPYESEWLYDQTWYFSPEGQLHKIGLLMECEWSSKLTEIQYDFEKLLVGRAPIKVMVFACKDDKAFDLLMAGFTKFSHSDRSEQYLLACWRDGPPRYEIREWPPATSAP